MPPPLEIPEFYNTLPFSQIKLTHHAPEPSIVILTLHRPNNHNAFTTTMMHEIERAYALFNADERVKCVVFTGQGRVFCAGADLQEGFGVGVDGQVGGYGHRDGGGRIALLIHHSRIPTIGALPGAAVGVGITLTLPMSIRISLSSAKIGFVFARRGIVMEACSSYFLPRLIGYSRATQAVTMGSIYRADDKIWDGLFAYTVEKVEDVLPKALEVAEEVVRNTSVVSTYLQREMMWRDSGNAEGQHLLDSRILYDLYKSADHKEGIESFMQKRPAKFTGTMENTAVSAYPWWQPVDTAGGAKGDLSSKPKL